MTEKIIPNNESKHHLINTLNESEKLAWMRLSHTENIGPVTFYKLIDVYGSASKAIEILP